MLAITTAACLPSAACHTTTVATAAHPSPSPPSATTTADPDASDSPADPSAPDTTTPTDTATATPGAPVAGDCLISPLEASTAFGHDAGRATGDASSCTYALGGILHVFANSYGDNAMNAYTAQRSSASGLPNFQDIDGVGDHAYVSRSDDQSLIEFVKGSTVVIIQLADSAEPTVAILTTLGQEAASRA